MYNRQKDMYRRAHESVELLLDFRDRCRFARGADLPPETTTGDSLPIAQCGTGTTADVSFYIPSAGSEEDPVGEIDLCAEVSRAVDAIGDSANTLLYRQPCWKAVKLPDSRDQLYPKWGRHTEGVQVDKGLTKDLRDLFSAWNGLCGHPGSGGGLVRTATGFRVPVSRDSQDTASVDMAAVFRFFRALTKLWREVLEANGKNPDDHPEQYEHLMDIE